MNKTKPFKRLNITLSPETWERLQKTTSRMERSWFIDNALRAYLVHLKQKILRRKLKEEATRHAVSDLKVAKEWFVLELLHKKEISQGKAAELLEISRHDLFDLMAQYDIPMIDMTSEELQKELDSAKEILKK